MSAEEAAPPPDIAPAEPSTFRKAMGQKRFVVGLTITVLLVLFVVIGPHLAPFGETEVAGPPFSKDGVLGTDYLGQDVLSRLMYGGTSILLIAVFVVSLAVAGGLTFVLNQLNPAYSSEGILAREGIPVLGSVSMFISPAVALRRKTELTGFLTGTLGFVALYAAIVLSMNWTTQALDSLLR